MTAPSLLILGTDVVLAAAPATPVQLAHACRAAGYHAVIPMTWGEELIAARVLERVRESEVPLVQCSCPLVAERLATHGATIAPMMLAMVPPPVAAARYLRALYAPTQPTITFAGGCVADGQQEIDVCLSVDALMKRLADRGIELRTQPTEFDSVLPPDRRRFYSEPGAVPTQSALRELTTLAEFVELDDDDFVVELGQRLLSHGRVLVDVAPALGCHCIGATGAVRADAARARIRDAEPPRSSAPVLDHSVAIVLDESLAPPAAAVSAVTPDTAVAVVSSDPESPPPTIQTPPHAVEVIPDADLVVVETVARRTPPGAPRAVLGTMPQAKAAGRQLPRAYVARRRSSPRGIRQSGVRRWHGLPAGEVSSKKKWLTIAGAGLAAGLALAWLLLLAM